MAIMAVGKYARISAGVAQRWLLVRSERPATASSRTLAKTCSKTVPASSKPSPNCVPDVLLVRRMPKKLS